MLQAGAGWRPAGGWLGVQQAGALKSLNQLLPPCYLCVKKTSRSHARAQQSQRGRAPIERAFTPPRAKRMIPFAAKADMKCPQYTDLYDAVFDETSTDR